MKIIFFRHAAAIDRSISSSDDRRYLTPKGRAFCRKTVRTMMGKKVDPDLILTSPLLRAVQTADILAESLTYNGPLVAESTLEPGFALAGLKQLLKKNQLCRELVIVGHEPDLSGVIAALLGLPDGFSFRKGSAIRLTIEAADLRQKAVFKWLAVGGKLITSGKEAFG